MRRLISFFVLLLSLVCTLDAKSQQGSRLTPADKAARYFESIRKSPPQQLAFLLKMPKGGDLHSHLSGAIYAESYIQWAADNGLCINSKTLSVTSAQPCDEKSDRVPASQALRNSVLYRQLIDAWSMRNWQLSGQSGHDHFFDTFGRFGAATANQTGRMLAEAVARAARGQVLYVEFMLTPDGAASSLIGERIGWDKSETTLEKLKTNGIAEAAKSAITNLRSAEVEKDRLLKCGSPEADAGCSVTIRYIAQVSRGSSLGVVFAQMVTGFALANDPDSKVVALNLVQPEDGVGSMQNFSLHMQMLKFLRPLYPHAHLSLHAGELAPGLTPPEGLSFHVHDSVLVAGADRIGHGVDIMHERDPYDLLREMAKRNVMVEICLTSNDTILGITGAEHPLAMYLEYGVPVALATDDEGVARSEMSREFLRAANDQGLGYLQLKKMARNSLEYAFISGTSLWSDARKSVPVAQCARDFETMRLTTNECQAFIKTSEKAALQWRLEEQLRNFEIQY